MDPISNAKIFCKNCHLQFLNRAKLHFHRKVVHSQIMNQTENVYVSSNLEKLQYEPKSDLNTNKTLFQCSICEARFKTKQHND